MVSGVLFCFVFFYFHILRNKSYMNGSLTPITSQNNNLITLNPGKPQNQYSQNTITNKNSYPMPKAQSPRRESQHMRTKRLEYKEPVHPIEYQKNKTRQFIEIKKHENKEKVFEENKEKQEVKQNDKNEVYICSHIHFKVL